MDRDQALKLVLQHIEDTFATRHDTELARAVELLRSEDWATDEPNAYPLTFCEPPIAVTDKAGNVLQPIYALVGGTIPQHTIKEPWKIRKPFPVIVDFASAEPDGSFKYTINAAPASARLPGDVMPWGIRNPPVDPTVPPFRVLFELMVGLSPGALAYEYSKLMRRSAQRHIDARDGKPEQPI